MRYIYLDVLLLVNVYVNFFMLLAASMLSHRAVPTRRLVMSAILGSLFSLALLLPELGFWLSLALKASGCVAIALAAFGLRGLAKSSLLLFLVSLLFGGAFCAASALGMNITDSNGAFYFDISLLSIAVFTVLAYLAVRLAAFLRLRSDVLEKRYTVTVSAGDANVALPGFADSGNCLCDNLSGLPVIVCGKSSLAALTRLDSGAYPNGYRYIPLNTVSGGAVIESFLPDRITISDEHGSEKTVRAVVALSTAEERAIFNPKLLL